MKGKKCKWTMRQIFGKIIGKTLAPCNPSHFPQFSENCLNKETFRQTFLSADRKNSFGFRVYSGINTIKGYICTSSGGSECTKSNKNLPNMTIS